MKHTESEFDDKPLAAGRATPIDQGLYMYVKRWVWREMEHKSTTCVDTEPRPRVQKAIDHSGVHIGGPASQWRAQAGSLDVFMLHGGCFSSGRRLANADQPGVRRFLLLPRCRPRSPSIPLRGHFGPCVFVQQVLFIYLDLTVSNKLWQVVLSQRTVDTHSTIVESTLVNHW